MLRYDPEQCDQFLRDINILVAEYEPGPDIYAQTPNIHLRVVSGPAGSGKDTVIRKSGLHDVSGVTSRAMRAYELAGTPDYRRYFDLGSIEDRIALLERLNQGSFVQVIPHPTTSHVYGTELEDYADHCVLDATAGEYDRLRKLNMFGSLGRICVVAPTFEEQMRRLTKRDGAHASDRRARLEEAPDSLRICLADPETIFLVNDDADRAAGLMRQIVEGAKLPSSLLEYGRHVGAAVLHELEQSFFSSSSL
jgi:guanylate kinase